MTLNPRDNNKMDKDDQFDALGGSAIGVAAAHDGWRMSPELDREAGRVAFNGRWMIAGFYRWVRMCRSWRGLVAALFVSFCRTGASPSRWAQGGAPMA